ncbi:Putative axial regulator YABBY 2 [Zea mays]|nr:Putative axial regulator YABBY 2 [Zea mays]
MLNIVTVRCGHCANLLSVNLRALMHSLPEQDHQLQENIKVHGINGTLHDDHQYCGHLDQLGSSSSSRFRRLPVMCSPQNEQHLLQEQTLNNNARRKAPFHVHADDHAYACLNLHNLLFLA